MALPAVSVALSQLNDKLSEAPCEADDNVEELVSELTWMQVYLADSEKTPQGRERSEIWSAAIERLGLCAQQAAQSNKSRDIDYLNKRLASLREKIQPFVCCCEGSNNSGVVTPVPAVPTIEIPNEIQIGAWGGPGGNKWEFKPNAMIKQITIVHGTVIDSISFTSVSADGKVQAPVKYGGLGGDKTVQVNINGPQEYLIGISGTYGPYDWDKRDVIRSISFKTNVKSYGPYGSTNGTNFSFEAGNGKIIGFHGRAGDYVDAIGVYVTSL